MTRTKSIENIEKRMADLDVNSLRYQILENAKKFKTSWIDLGRALYSVWKDKLYKEWGYSTFDNYTSREIGIRKVTAMKLLRSYSFLEKEEPEYLKADYADSSDAALVPNYESVDLLRQAKGKKLDEDDYTHFKKDIFEKGKDALQLKRELTALIRQRKELDPEEVRQQRRLSTLKRFLSTLRSLRQEIETAKLLPEPLIREASALIKKLEAELV